MRDARVDAGAQQVADVLGLAGTFANAPSGAGARSALYWETAGSFQDFCRTVARHVLTAAEGDGS